MAKEKPINRDNQLLAILYRLEEIMLEYKSVGKFKGEYEVVKKLVVNLEGKLQKKDGEGED
jgi:recombinational DNA repair protein RecR